MRCDRLDFVVHEQDLVFLRLASAILQELFACNPFREAEIIFHDRFPFRHGMAGIDDQRVALRTSKVNRRGQAGDPAPNDNHFACVRLVEVGVLDHAVAV
jgi:hypothetical protein